MRLRAIPFLLSYSLLIGLIGCVGTQPISSTSIESTQPATVQLPSPAPSLELNAIALNNQGVAKIEAQDFRCAVSDFTAAIAQQPKLAEAYLGRGYASLSLEKYPTALQDLNKALQLKPDYAEAYEYSGDVQAKLQRSGEALENWRKAEALYTQQGRADKVELVKDKVAELEIELANRPVTAPPAPKVEPTLSAVEPSISEELTASVESESPSSAPVQTDIPIREPRYGQGCECPYDRAKNGSRCGKRSAWYKPGGEDPVCFKGE